MAVIARLIPAAVAIAVPAAAGALAPVQQSFRVGATVATGCEVRSTAGASWGAIDLGTVTGVASGTVSADLVSGGATGLQVDCTPGTTLGVTADMGANASGGVRQLALPGNAAARIPYRLLVTSARTSWDAQSVALSFPVGTSRLALPIAAVATLPGSQAPGAYSDTVRITLSW